jgi:Ca-activated chloride channel homolog
MGVKRGFVASFLTVAGGALCLLLFAFQHGFAQGRNDTTSSADGQRPAVKINAEIIADVHLVQVPVIVFDQNGAVATNLTRDDFRLTEDGVEQQILNVDKERSPVSFVMLADVSASMRRKIPFVQEAALSLLDPENAQDKYPDEYSLIGVESRVRPLAPFTRNQAELQHQIPQLITATTGTTALFDGIYYGIATAQHAQNKRRAMIIISDGGDNHSRYSLNETRKFLQEADMPVFAVMAGGAYPLDDFLWRLQTRQSRSHTSKKRVPGLPPVMESKVTEKMASEDTNFIDEAERRGPHNLKTLTEVTGGGVFTAEHEEDLARIVATIGQAVRYRYLLSYKPSREESGKGNSLAHAWHKIRLELKPKEKFAAYGLPYYKRGYAD